MAESGKEALEDVKRKEKRKEKSFTGRRLLTLINTSPICQTSGEPSLFVTPNQCRIQTEIDPNNYNCWIVCLVSMAFKSTASFFCNTEKRRRNINALKRSIKVWLGQEGNHTSFIIKVSIFKMSFAH